LKQGDVTQPPNRSCGVFCRNQVVFVKVVFCCAALLLSAVLASATIDSSLQMQLGNPSNATADANNHTHYLIQRTIEALDYNDTLGEANWASWDLTAGDANSAVARQDSFAADTSLPAGFYQVANTEYSGSGYDRGHLCPSADRTDSTNDNDMTFLMSNMMPQAPDNNRIVWANFEDYCRTFADTGNEVLIMCGPSGFSTNHISGSTHVLIPSNTWKIAVIVPLGSGTALSRITTITNRVITIRVPNTNGVSAYWTNYITSAHQVELETGFTFFTALPGTIASAFRARIDNLANPPLPGITSFTPASGLPNASVVIVGTNFNSASVVSFNGANAAFTVNSGTQITATVPTNASSGLISVTTPGGTATSSSSFAVAGAATVDLDIASTHTGTFTQGETGATYTLSVTNIGSLASTGTVSVVNTLPAGLSATAIVGSGWTANLGTLTCTRSDTLAVGAGYPPITVTVNVATNAPTSVTNAAVVSGGGDAVSDLTSDPTIINPASTGGSNIYSGTLIGWDMSILTGGSGNYGASPLQPATNAPNLTVVGLTRGSGISTSGTAATNAWGGLNWTNATASLAVASNKVVTFSVMANAGYKVSFASVNRFDYRRSPTGPTNGVLQYQIGSGTFNDVTNLNYPVTSSSGGSIGAIDLTGFVALQNIGAGTNVTFRIVNYLGAGPSGSWYVSEVVGSTAPDLALSGTVTQVLSVTNPPAIVPALSASMFTGGQFQFTLAGTTGSNYVVQAATNLAAPAWIPIWTNAAPFMFTESNANVFPQRFYRAVVAP
jgi:endonuclease G